MSCFDGMYPDNTDFTDFDRTSYCSDSGEVPYPGAIDEFFEELGRVVTVQLAEEGVIDFHFDGGIGEDTQPVFYADIGL